MASLAEILNQPADRSSLAERPHLGKSRPIRTSRLRAFNSDEDAFNAGMWLRAIVARFDGSGRDEAAERHCNRLGLEVTNAQSEGVGSAGGFVVPSPLLATIIDVRERVGVTRRVVNVQPMTSDTLDIPKRAGGLTVVYPGEGTSIAPSDPAKAQINLVARKRAVASEITQELVDDAIISVVDNTFSEMGHALALQEDNEFINGDGSGGFGTVTGLKNAIGSAGIYTAPTGSDTWPELALEDFTNTMARLPDRFAARDNMAWICSWNFFASVLTRIAFEAGGSAALDVLRGVAGARTFLGQPIFLTPHMPTATAVNSIAAFFGSFRDACVLGDRIGVRMARDDSIGFLRDVVTLKATARYDLNVYEAGDASNPGAYVALRTAAS